MKPLIALVTLPVLLLGLLNGPSAEAATLSGKVAVSKVVAQLVVLPEVTSPEYDRALFKHWTDQDKNGCDARQDVLIQESLVPSAMAPTGCKVVSGKWLSWYDGVTTTNPSDLDIDHMIPLSESWKSGAYAWTPAQREAFANDIDFAGSLTAVSASSNRSKGDKDLAKWLPTQSAMHCIYVTDWVLTKYRWNLSVDSVEKSAIDSLTAGNCGETVVAVPARQGTPEFAVPTPKITETPTSKPDPVVIPGVSRLFGADRYSTSVAISMKFEKADVVYVATGEGYADALAAASAAAAAGGPLLLTAGKSLPAAVAKEIMRLKPKTIVVAGGPGAVSAGVVNSLEKIAPVKRLGGADRFETGRLIVGYAFKASATAYVATGLDFPDALSAAGAAGAIGAPVILVDGQKKSVDKPTAALLEKLGVSKINIAGGTGAVSASLGVALERYGSVTRLDGADRYTTSVAINKFAFQTSDQAYFAVGTGFADALAGAALAGKNKAPLYVVPQNCVSPTVIGDLNTLMVQQRILLGGTAVLGTGVEKLTSCGGAAPKPPVTKPTPGPTPTPTPPPLPEQPSSPGDAKNCGDFETWRAAQNWYETYFPYYGDVARLDGDGDGIACQSLPGAPNT